MFPPATTDYLDCLRPGTLVTLSVIALKEYWLKFSLVEEQTAQVTWASLLVGVTVSIAQLHSPGEPFICEPVPLLKARAACFGKAYAGKRPQAQLLAAHWLLCYYPEKEEGWSYQTADGSV